MTTAADSLEFSLTERAAKRVAFLIEQEGQEGLMLRVAVSGGGCSGFQYGFSFDDTVNSDDRTFERDGVVTVVDETSLELLNGAQVDFVEDLGAASFQIKNPNATSSCGCGSSFAI
ncbi:iron-sulfur cluster insertion protein ErpA [Pelagibius marinus]|uniref:iron-sulfur cluster insertion protein ErpA n=1 Tax=Pelagibius marinus TaxID=2762760 RepID=UPI0018730580|nr:iron-sulfur cluster insertion protein ErpA [Pelagibius marinus]